MADPIRIASEHFNAGRMEQAREAAQRAVRKSPDDPRANHMLALVLSQLRQLDQAEFACRRAVRREPANGGYLNTLGMILERLGKDESVDVLRRATEVSPGLGAAWNNLGNALVYRSRLDEAEASFVRALEIDPGFLPSIGNLAVVRLLLGRADEACELLREADRRSPGHAFLLDKLCHCINYDADATPAAILDVHRRWGESMMHGVPAPSFSNAPEPGRKLRVGYLSPDLRTHSVAYFAEPAIVGHDADSFEVFCYSASAHGDETTDRLKRAASGWRQVEQLDDEALARAIRSDRIDILVELSGHTTGTRLNALRFKPAPVVATYIGYPATTGLPTVDARLVDAITDPPGEEVATERLVRLPGCFLCYRPPEGAPEPAGATQDGARPLTFGSFNALAKFSERVVELWARILLSVPGSRMILKNAGFRNESALRRFGDMFEARGVERSRVDLLDIIPSTSGHLGAYDRVDIALDTFPYNGTTTTCEAIWMGVPVVTLRGDRHAARVGASLLEAAGLPGLVASGPDDYVRIAAELAGDPTRLREIKSGLRERVRASRLCDAGAFVPELEASYRALWRDWCERAGAER